MLSIVSLLMLSEEWITDICNKGVSMATASYIIIMQCKIYYK